ncbi:MAG: ABC transporter ATP-binding protein [Actinomycetota bacterium]
MNQTFVTTPADAGPGRLIRWLILAQWRMVALGATAGVVWMAGFLIIPILVGEAIDDAIDRAGTTAMAGWIIAVLAVVAISAAAGALRHRCAISLWVNTAHLSEGHLSRRVLDRRGGVTNAPGELVSLGVGDADKIGNIADITNRGSGAVVTLIGASIWLLSTSLSLGLLVLVAVPASAAVIAPFLSSYDRRATAERRELADATAAAADGITGLRTAHGLGGGAQVRSWFRERSAGMHAAALSLVRLEARLFAAIGILPWFTLVPVLWVGGGQAIDGEISPGTLITVVGLAQFLVQPIGTLGEVAQYLTAGRASARRITEVTTTPTAIRDDGFTGNGDDWIGSGGDGPERNGSAAVVGQSGSAVPALVTRALRYGPVGPLNLTVADGETVGVACRSAGDAAAIASLLHRHRDPTDGSILIRGRNVHTVPLADLPTTLAVVDTERPWLLAGTLLDNLRLARADATPDDALTALHAAGADDLINHPDALDRPIGERGLRLSGGQRQRVALAQALLMRPEVLVVIEPTSALDAVTEATVVQRLRTTTRPATVIITTAPAVLACCDRVVFVCDGLVAATGTHTELVETNGDYRHLVGGTE